MESTFSLTNFAIFTPTGLNYVLLEGQPAKSLRRYVTPDSFSTIKITIGNETSSCGDSALKIKFERVTRCPEIPWKDHILE